MNDAIRILFVEDSPADAELAQREIKQVLNQCDFLRVENREDYLAALKSFQPDLIISDYRLPRFDGLTALKLALARVPLTPVIILTGAINEDTAVECMKAGATDYVIKEHIKRLGQTVIHAIEEKQLRNERKQAEEEATRLGQVLDDSLSEIYTFDSETLRFVQVNKGARDNLGYSLAELKQMTPLDLKPEFTARLFAQLLEPLRTGAKEKVQFTTVHRRKDGSLYPVEVNLQLSAIGASQVFVAIIVDISERKQIEEQIRRQERLAAIGQLAAGIAHDFNNIMAVITLYAQLLSLSPNLTEKERHRLETIYQQANRAANLTGQILDFSRQSVMQRQPIDLLSFLQELTQLLTRTLPEHIKIDLTYEAGEYLVNADATRLQQAVMNLALNARDAMPGGGTLQFRLELAKNKPGRLLPLPIMGSGEWVTIIVSDNGTGIQPDVLPHLFEPFFTTKAPGQGTGLGLAQVYGIVKQHNGHIDYESRVGEGTTFSLYLPALSMSQPEAVTGETKLITKGQGQLILVVEDNDATREALVDSLAALNYQVLTAANGEKALAVLEEHGDEVSLVLSDMVMPEMGGLQLLQTLKQKRIDVPVVMLTGHPLADELKALQAEGLKGWMPKPVTVEKLAQIVAQVL